MYKIQIASRDFPDPYNGFFQEICQFEGFDSEESFNSFCHAVLNAWPLKYSHMPLSPDFHEYLNAIEAKKDMTISTPWGGVFITKHQPPLVEKYLVVKGGYYLSFEKHELKDENIKVESGEGVLLQRQGDSIQVRKLSPGVEAHFAPGDEHCIIAPQNLLLFESSLDHKGMDQDLIFIYNPS